MSTSETAAIWDAVRTSIAAPVLPAPMRLLRRLGVPAHELVLVSAGFDAHRADPLAGLELEEADFGWVTTRLMEAANRHAQGRLVSILEGGYDLKALAGSAAAHVAALMKAN